MGSEIAGRGNLVPEKEKFGNAINETFIIITYRAYSEYSY
jgi:hypothetical protein